MPKAINEHSHATLHWNNTTTIAHLCPSSRLIDAIAAIHGVYNRQNTNSEAMDTGDMIDVSDVPASNNSNVDTTLSFAIKPVTKPVVIRQSLNPCNVAVP